MAQLRRLWALDSFATVKDGILSKNHTKHNKSVLYKTYESVLYKTYENIGVNEVIEEYILKPLLTEQI